MIEVVFKLVVFRKAVKIGVLNGKDVVNVGTADGTHRAMCFL